MIVKRAGGVKIKPVEMEDVEWRRLGGGGYLLRTLTVVTSGWVIQAVELR